MEDPVEIATKISSLSLKVSEVNETIHRQYF